jgi:ankyrin repeat protein
MSSNAEKLAEWKRFSEETGIDEAIRDGDTYKLTDLLARFELINNPLEMYQPWGVEALRTAVRYGYAGIVKILLDCGVHPGGSKSIGTEELLQRLSALLMACSFEPYNPPRHFGVQPDFPEVVRLLLSRGANIHDRDIRGNTPLHLLALCPGPSCVEVACILLEYGADVNALDVIGGTPLFAATMKHSNPTIEQLDYQTRIAEFLLCHDADPSITGDGQTPLALARASGQNLHLIHLLEAEADFMANEFKKRAYRIEQAFGTPNVEPWIINNIMQHARRVDMERIIERVKNRERS